MHLKVIEGENDAATEACAGKAPAYMVACLSGAGMWMISGFAALNDSPKIAIAYGIAAAAMSAVAYRIVPREVVRKRA